ncbi:hypothetical protein [Deinococcus altitudinis]|uniref:hypothetical protein n=1 Tax=Deinococcus altitudinis TaxID=468914 RepID=UPI0038923F18
MTDRTPSLPPNTCRQGATIKAPVIAIILGMVVTLSLTGCQHAPTSAAPATKRQLFKSPVDDNGRTTPAETKAAGRRGG